MANEVKRWTSIEASMHWLKKPGEPEWVLSTDFDVAIANKDGKIAVLTEGRDKLYQASMSYIETISEQKRVIEFMKSEFQKLAKHETRVGASHVELSVVEAYRKLAAEVISEIETKLGMK